MSDGGGGETELPSLLKKGLCVSFLVGDAYFIDTVSGYTSEREREKGSKCIKYCKQLVCDGIMLYRRYKRRKTDITNPHFFPNNVSFFSSRKI